MSFIPEQNKKKSWKGMKNVLKAFFKQDKLNKRDSDFNLPDNHKFIWNPPMILKLEESVFNPEFGVTLDYSPNNSSESLLDSLSSSSSNTINQVPFYMNRVNSNFKLPLKSSLKTMKRSPSEPCIGKIYKDDSEDESSQSNSPSVNNSFDLPSNYLQITFPFESNNSESTNTSPLQRRQSICTSTAAYLNTEVVPSTPISLPSSLRKKKRAKKISKTFRFNDTVIVYETYNNEDYPRTAVDPPELTPKQIIKLNKEIRKFKLDEMKCHPQSLSNLQLGL